ncbi:glutamate receptor 8 [Plakobranchus ocellatus]|uniref:Glutamate receptor 8 n=1 Tax=Plakobranchus ocellatus TaxID=259542 RepID=A0AAV4BAZ8_9GAST|nr:glutamate receptor 8 [Plakobranchus ocellatus]
MRAGLFPILMVYLLAGVTGAACKLKIGVAESFLSNVESALDKTNLTGKITVVTLDTANGTSSLGDINKLYSDAVDENLHAIVGPFNAALDMIAESLNTIYLCTTYEASRTKRANTFEMLPYSQWVAQAILDLLASFKWTEIAFFHDDDNAMHLLEHLVNNRSVIVRAWQLDWRASRKDLKAALVEMRGMGVENIVVVMNKFNTRKILYEALQLAMLSTPPHEWVFYDPGLESKNEFTKYEKINVNFTILSLVEFNNTLGFKAPLSLEDALTSDALQHLYSSYSNVTASAALTNTSLTSDEMTSAMIDAMQKSQEFGHTGLLTFDDNRQRTELILSLTAVLGDISYSRGIWFSHPPALVPLLNLNTAVFPISPSAPFPLQGRVLKVVAILEAPFVMLKKDQEGKKGNDRFYGYSVDLLDEIAQMLDFEYELYLVQDGKFGREQTSGKWNGVVGELIAGNASLSVAPLSINANRERVIDFTKPFMTRHISVLLHIPQYKSSFFQFLSPFSTLVWIVIILAFLVMSLFLYTLEAIDRALDHTLKDKPRASMKESFWFSFGSLLQGSTDPIAFSLPGRILTSAWWFFALVLVSSYTANLAAFLTIRKINTPIDSLTDLTRQDDIKYGTVKDSGITNFFEQTSIDYFSKMWAEMSEMEQDSMVENMDEAIEKVKEGSYAFFWDTASIKYLTSIDCDLMEIGPPFDPKGIGIGVPTGASYVDQLSLAILSLSDSSRLQDLENKYVSGERVERRSEKGTWEK